MKQVFRYALAVLGVSLAVVSAAPAQVAYNEGTVNRVVLISIAPGHFSAFMADLKKNIVPIWESEKSAGLIIDYHIFLNTTSSGPEDWDLGYTLTYKNMAALDGLGMKVLDLRMKQYGDKSKEQQVINKRVDNLQQVASYLIRNVTLK